MANLDAPFGLRPIKRRGSGGNSAIGTTPYYIPSGYATALFIGDPVVKTGTSNTARVEAPGVGSFEPGMLAAINKATAGSTNPITGVIVGFAPNPDGLESLHNPASTERVAFVADDPAQVFLIQADDTVAAADIGLNASVVYTNSGSTATGISGVELDISTKATTATLALKILRVSDERGRNELSSWCVLEVLINNHTEANASAGI